MFDSWKDGEYRYCAKMVLAHGDDSVTHEPKTIATYLRLQAAHAFREGHYEISARLGAAATCINEDARNNHPPRWEDATDILIPRRAAG